MFVIQVKEKNGKWKNMKVKPYPNTFLARSAAQDFLNKNNNFVGYRIFKPGNKSESIYYFKNHD